VQACCFQNPPAELPSWKWRKAAVLLGIGMPDEAMTEVLIPLKNRQVTGSIPEFLTTPAVGRHRSYFV